MAKNIITNDLARVNILVHIGYKIHSKVTHSPPSPPPPAWTPTTLHGPHITLSLNFTSAN